ncbi:MAG: hypothetical protein U0790_00305 [Isosphaeraceae bacterium]
MMGYYDPPDPGELPCEICGQEGALCLCPECPECGACGDPACYAPGGHGLIRTEAQVQSLKNAQAAWEADALADRLHADEYARSLMLDIDGIDPDVRRCRECGCTDDDCSDCIERTGEPCHWVEANLCSACADAKGSE